MYRKRIAILGSTGSIGTQALQVIESHPDRFEVVALSTYQNIQLILEQARKFSVKKISVVNSNVLDGISIDHSEFDVDTGYESLIQIASMDNVDMVLVAVVGIAGLQATIAALESGKDVALANKETLVVGGDLVMETARRFGKRIIPVDSEHSAIFQCLNTASGHQEVKRIILTASGGPFRGYNRESLKRVTVSDALKHPNWSMGKKITIDSATLMNKGLEVIEAKWLFDVEIDKIQVVVHPQSIIHSMVEFTDGSIIAQLGRPDMRLPILYALSYPERFSSDYGGLDFFEIGKLTFEEPDVENFPCLPLAYKAARIGGTMPTVLNAANEVAVQKFLQEEISFMEIPIFIEKAMKSHKVIQQPKIDDILSVDKEVREFLS